MRTLRSGFLRGLLALTLLAILTGSAWHFFRKKPPMTHEPSLLSFVTEDSLWLNTSRPLTKHDLKGRILLLDFWTFCCINCMHVIPELKSLEEEFKSNLTVIGIHSAKFENEKDTSAIRSAILRYGITHPVINDFQFKLWRGLGVNAWPTLVLINPAGEIVQAFAGEGHTEALRSQIRELIQKEGRHLETRELPLALEKDKAPPSILSFPSKLTFDPQKKLLFVSDSGHHRILALKPSGEIEFSVGAPELSAEPSYESGKKDGNFNEARFNHPQGLLYRNDKLYVADTENHLLREVDLIKKTVTTLAGTGVQGFERNPFQAPALATPLSSPWDLAWKPGDPDQMVIAMAGTHQLWTYDLKKKTLDLLAGNGAESIEDGPLPRNSLSQPSGLSTYQDRLYFVDSETSSLRVYHQGKVETLIGSGLFVFGLNDGPKGEGRLQHPLGLWADSSGVIIADTYNHALRRFHWKTRRLETLVGKGERGFQDGDLNSAQMNEPSGIIRIENTFYFTDTNNHQIRILDLEKKSVKALPLSYSSGYLAAHPTPTEQTQPRDFLPRLKTAPTPSVRAQHPVTVQIALTPGWKINETAPSWLALFKKESSGKYSLVQEFKKEDLKKLNVVLPSLHANEKYRLQGTFYYCKKAEGSLCSVESRDLELIPTDQGSTATISIELQQE